MRLGRSRSNPRTARRDRSARRSFFIFAATLAYSPVIIRCTNKNFWRSLGQARATQSQTNAHNALATLGRSCAKTVRQAKAIERFLKALDIARALDAPVSANLDKKMAAQSFLKLEQFRQAAELFERAAADSDTLYTKERFAAV